MALREEEGEDRRDRDSRQADDEEERQPGKARVVALPDTLVLEQLEPPTPRITP